MAQRKKTVWLVLLLQLIAGLLLLAACSDETVSGTSTPGQRPANLSGTAAPGGNQQPSVPQPTPTYTPLPATPTVAPTPTPPVSLGGKATGAFINDALTLHPYKTNNQTGQTYISLLFAAALTHRDPQTLQLQPGAAASWKVDGSTVTFTLRDNLKWSDGQPLTSADYLWTYQQLKKSENGWALARSAFYDPANPASTGIESYAAPDPRTLVIKLHTASADLVSRADVIEPLPQHTWAGLDWNDSTKNPQILNPTVVSGPWQLKEWKRGNSITFERNLLSTVWPNSRLDSLSFQIVPDSQVALQKVKQGEVDFYTPALADYAAFAGLSNVQTYNWGPARPTWYFVGFNFRKPILQDKTLRQALAWATDRKSMLDKQAYGLGQLINSSVSPWQPAFQPNTARYELNLDKARDLLKGAGYTFQDNHWVNKAGINVPAFKLVYNAPSPVYEGLAATLKANFAALGVTLNLQNFDYEDYVKYLNSPDADYDLFLSGWTTDYAPENFGEVWRTPQLNNGAYDNSRLLDMYAKAAGESDPAKRKDWLNQVQSIEAEELPYIFLYAEKDLLVVNKRLAGFSPGLLGPDHNLYTDWFATS